MRCVVTDALFPPLSLSLSLSLSMSQTQFLFVVVPFHHHHPIHTTSQYLFTHNNLRAATLILDAQLSVIGCHIIGWHESSCDNAL